MATGVVEASDLCTLFKNVASSDIVMIGFKIIDRYQSNGCHERIDYC